jgi:hypothetical protein
LKKTNVAIPATNKIIERKLDPSFSIPATAFPVIAGVKKTREPTKKAIAIK